MFLYTAITITELDMGLSCCDGATLVARHPKLKLIFSTLLPPGCGDCWSGYHATQHVSALGSSKGMSRSCGLMMLSAD